MKPYYQEPNITIYNGDCLEVMNGMEQVDCVITSPPYNMRTRIRNGEYTQREKSEHFSKKYTEFDDGLPIKEYCNFHKSIINKMLLISPMVFLNIQIVTGSKEVWFALIGEFNKHIKDIIIWDKGTGQPAMHNSVINRGYEMILILEAPVSAGRAFKSSYFKRGTMPDVWRLGRGGNGKAKGHGAVFPKKLVYKILENWTRPGATILDPFLGSGTTARACKDLGRKCIGIEISKEYVDIAIKRLGQEVLF